jgi:hypothetical protein
MSIFSFPAEEQSACHQYIIKFSAWQAAKRRMIMPGRMLKLPFHPAAPMLRARLREARGGAGHTAEKEANGMASAGASDRFRVTE